jgi:NAD(P)-dependent dehydrogenase (short-subunit alcohol dehydrogenase family)
VTAAGNGPVLATGGTSGIGFGIGFGIAEAVVRGGRPVTVLGRVPHRSQQAAKARADVASSEGQVLARSADTTDEGAVHDEGEHTVVTWGRLDGLVTSAGRLT